MIYTLTRSIVKMALKGFYYNIRVIGKKNLIEDVPTIFLSNHPSALMDPLVVSTHIGRKLHFIAAAEYFGKGFQSWLLQHEFNMIPVYRPSHYEGKKIDNSDMFRECYEALNKNKSIIIYPEGTSESVHNIRNLKTGAVRIAQGFKDAFPDRPIYLQPIGVNYSHLQQFQSSVVIKIGKPVEIDGFNEGEKSIASWTSKMEEEMKEQVLHAENHELSETVRKINWVFLKKLEGQMKIGAQKIEDRFRLRKNLIRAVNYFNEKTPEQVKKMTDRIDRLIEMSRAQNIPEYAFHRNWSYTDLVLLILGSPFFLLGLIINGGPFLVVRNLFRKMYLPKIRTSDDQKGINPAFVGTISFSLGTLMFLFWFLLISIAVGANYSWWIGILTFAGIYGLGQLTLIYYMAARRFLQRWNFQKALKRSSEVQAMEKERLEILDELGKFKEAFLRDQPLN